MLRVDFRMESARLHTFARSRAARAATWMAFLACTAGMLISCTTNDPKQPTGPTVVSCTSDEECASLSPPLKCDLTRRECVCTSDLMCANPTPFCNVITGRCVEKLAGCTATSCGDGQFCDASTRTCQPLREYCSSCVQDAQCGTGNRCVLHPDFPDLSRPFCAAACGAGNACPDGQECRDTNAGVKQCVPKGALCTGQLTCTPDAFTICENDSQCSQTPGQRCDTVLDRCVASTNVCAPGQACDPRSRTCVQECTTDDQCRGRLGDGFVCLQRACRPANECTSDSQCSVDQFCLKSSTDPNAIGRCTATCQQDAECPIGKRCLAQDGGRKQCVSACTNDGDCLLNEICTAGTCEPGRCQVKAVCGFAENCVDNRCVKEPNNCATCPAAPNSCPGGGKCSPVAFNDQCGDPSCNRFPGSRTVCITDSSTGCAGQYCYCVINRCLTPCFVDAECPQGFACTQLVDGSYCNPVGSGQFCLNPP